MAALDDALKKCLQDAGAALVGFGDLRGVKGAPLPVGVSVAVPIPIGIVETLKQAPTKEYHAAYHALNARLDEIIAAGARFLEEQGYRALAQTLEYVDANRYDRWDTLLPHKTVATRAGLGWIGKSCLLVTKEYGSAVRLSSLLTDAPLRCAVPIDRSGCGNCSLCVDACPGHALSGTLWEAGMARDCMVAARVCRDKQLAIMRSATGIDQELCGKCFAVCAFTQGYIRRLRKSDGPEFKLEERK